MWQGHREAGEGDDDGFPPANPAADNNNVNQQNLLANIGFEGGSLLMRNGLTMVIYPPTMNQNSDPNDPNGRRNIIGNAVATRNADVEIIGPASIAVGATEPAPTPPSSTARNHATAPESTSPGGAPVPRSRRRLRSPQPVGDRAVPEIDTIMNG